MTCPGSRFRVSVVGLARGKLGSQGCGDSAMRVSGRPMRGDLGLSWCRARNNGASWSGLGLCSGGNGVGLLSRVGAAPVCIGGHSGVVGFTVTDTHRCRSSSPKPPAFGPHRPGWYFTPGSKMSKVCAASDTDPSACKVSGYLSRRNLKTEHASLPGPSELARPLCLPLTVFSGALVASGGHWGHEKHSSLLTGVLVKRVAVTWSSGAVGENPARCPGCGSGL